VDGTGLESCPMAVFGVSGVNLRVVLLQR